MGQSHATPVDTTTTTNGIAQRVGTTISIAHAIGVHEDNPPHIQQMHQHMQVKKEKASNDFCVDIQNITHANNQRTGLLKRRAQCTFFQEHTLVGDDHTEFGEFCNNNGYNWPIVGPLDPELTKATGGVGFTIQKPYQGINVLPLTATFADAVASGRCNHSSIDIGATCTPSFFNIYGWKDGHNDKTAAGRTNKLISATKDEITEQPHGPKFIVGDVNAEPEDLPELMDLLNNQHWTDVGEHAYMWGQLAEQPTCKAPNADVKTRRDYIFANPEGLAIIKSFQVMDDELFPVHATLRMILDAKQVIKERRTVTKPLSISDKVEAAFEGIPDNIDEHGKHKIKYKEHLSKFHDTLDTLYDSHAAKFNEAFRQGSSTNFYELWSSIPEKAVKVHYSMTDSEAKDFSGRGKVKIKTIVTKGSPTIQVDTGTEGNGKLLNHSAELNTRRMQAQASRCNAWLHRNKSRAKLQTGDAKHVTFDTLDRRERQAILNHINSDVEHEVTLHGILMMEQCSDVKLNIALMKHARLYHDAFEVAARNAKTNGRINRKRELLDNDPHLKKAYKKIKGRSMPPLQFLKRDQTGPDGQCKGTWTANPSEVDSITRRRWATVFNGNVACECRTIMAFIFKYLPFIFFAPEYKIARIDPQSVMQTILSKNETAGGMDGWTLKDLKVISTKGITWLASMFDHIEDGMPWPDGTHHARAAYMAKDESKMGDPLSYRGLLITSVIYRVYATERLQNMHPWVLSWAMPSMFAGVPGASADDAWWLTALDLEDHMLQGNEITGGGADVRKCFDAILRRLVYMLLWMAGCPSGVIRAYKAMMEALVVYISTAGGLGQPHKRKCGIPQGCPFSMMIIALHMRPWLRFMSELGATPRVLADDVMVYMTSEWHLEGFTRAYTATLQYIQDMGARAAPEKSFIFSTSGQTRTWMKTFTWPIIYQPIKVVGHIRDLGTHLNTTCRYAATTSTKRLYEACGMIRKIGYLPHELHYKARMIRTKGFAMGLYGGEAVRVNETAMRKMQTRIADAIGPHSTLNSNAMVFSISSRGEDLDPHIELFARRYTMARRMEAKWTWVRAAITRIHKSYALQNLNGTNVHPDALKQLLPAPPPADGNKRPWEPNVQIRGPIGHIIAYTHCMAAAVDANLCIFQKDEEPLPTLEVPWQHLKPLVKDIGIRARNSYAATQRTMLDNIQELDMALFRKAASKLDKGEKAVLEWVATLSAWTEHKKESIGQALTSKCPHCGCEQVTIEHTIWNCNVLIDKAVGIDMDLCSIGASRILPRPLLVGLPPALAADLQSTYWGTTLDDYDGQLRKDVGAVEKPRHASAEVQALVRKTLETSPLLNARQVIQKLRGGHVSCEIAIDDESCSLSPPDCPNVYSDGSLKNPRNWYWGMGGYGVVWSSRDLRNQPLSQNELDYAYHEVDRDTVSFWGAMPGHINSSTRTELAAGILALCGKGPIHQGTDSKAFMDKATRILNGENLIRKTPWKLQKDGDLWYWYERLARAKGFHAIRLSKVKAHTNADDIVNGVITLVDQHFNRLADQCADKGAWAHDNNAMHVAYAFALRHRRYLVFLERVHKHIIKMLLLDRSLRESYAKPLLPMSELQKRKQQTKIQVASSLAGFTNQTLYRVALNHLPPQECLGDKYDLLRKVHRFMGMLEAETAEAGQAGSAWLEILYLFELVEGPLLVPNTGDGMGLKARATTKANIILLKGLIKNVLVHCGNAHHKLMFSPARVKQSRLAVIGYTNHVPSIRARLALHGHHNLPIVAAMLSNRMDVSKATVDSIAASRMRVVPSKLKLRKVPAWRSFASVFQNLIDFDICRSVHNNATMLAADMPIPDSLKLACPKCSKMKEVADKTLITKGRWCVITCSACKVPAKASRWLCECKNIWYNCTTHACIGYACRASNKRSRREKTSKQVDHSLFPSIHNPDSLDPSGRMKDFVSECVWDSLPKVQHRATLSKKPKCESQQQFSIIDNRPVFSITGTNVSKPGLKRKWLDESEDLVRAINRKREAPVGPGCFESPSSSKQEEIGNSQGQASEMQPCDQPCAVLAGMPCPVSSRSSSSNMPKRHASAWEQVQAKFRVKFARTAWQPFDPPSDTVEVSRAAPTIQGKQHEITRDNRWAPPEVPVEQICPMRVKRKAPTASIRPAGVKWGKRTSKEAITAS